MTIAHAEDEAAVLRCYPVMFQLRPQVAEIDFVERVLRQFSGGYRLACVEEEAQVRAVAGYRFSENLAWGRFCYVDDLVTDAGNRSKAYGRALFEWLIARAAEAGCEQFHLDSGVQRFDAHRFYLARRMIISSHHFSLILPRE